MTNPLVHALVFALAVIVPGGLLVYFGWRAVKARGKADKQLAPTEVKQAFLSMYPRESLRAKSRAARLNAYRTTKTRPRKKSQ